ncbi:hypothetical protein MY8738_003395 [Beauveria namnaoensis]
MGDIEPARPLQPKAARGQQRAPPYPAMKRRRPTGIACHHCRLKKIRCDGQRPACSSCEAKAVTCTYRDTLLSSKVSRESIPGVVQMLGQLCPAELVRVVSRLKDEGDAEIVLATIRDSLVKQSRQRDSASSDPPSSMAGSSSHNDGEERGGGACGPRTPEEEAVLPELGGGGATTPEIDWYWPPCQATTEFALHGGMPDAYGSIPDTFDEYWPLQWSRSWAQATDHIC